LTGNRWHKKYTNVGEESVKALKAYKAEVSSKTFPNKQVANIRRETCLEVMTNEFRSKPFPKPNRKRLRKF
jgi:hypothetical protein